MPIRTGNSPFVRAGGAVAINLVLLLISLSVLVSCKSTPQGQPGCQSRADQYRASTPAQTEAQCVFRGNPRPHQSEHGERLEWDYSSIVVPRGREDTSRGRLIARINDARARAARPRDKRIDKSMTAGEALV